MANPFLYPQRRQVRARAPVYRNYRQYKPDLREEFGGQCVYCRALDLVKGENEFGVDHYRPWKKFPHLTTDYANLFYCCNHCNRLKRDYWPNPRELREELFIPNPCDHVMFLHLRYKGGAVAAFSRAGAFTVDRLDLNDPRVVDFRTAFIQSLAFHDAQIKAVKLTISELKKRVKRAKTAAQRTEAESGLAESEADLEKLESMVKALAG